MGLVLGIVLASRLSVLADTAKVAFNKINIRVNNKNVDAENILYNSRTYVVQLENILSKLNKENRRWLA